MDELTERLKALVTDRDLREAFGREAYKTVTELWAAPVATERLLALCSALANGENGRDLYEGGPCSIVK